MTDVDQFLAAKTQLCVRQHARITPELCRVCRERGDAFCIGCSGLVPLQLETITGEEKRMGCFRGFCATCKKDDRPLLSANSHECHSCYKKRKNSHKQALEAVGMAHEIIPEGDPLVVDDMEPLHHRPVIDDSDFFKRETVYVTSPLPRAEIMRTVLRHSPAVRIDVELMDAWRDRGFTADHIMGLMELVLNDEIGVFS